MRRAEVAARIHPAMAMPASGAMAKLVLAREYRLGGFAD